jgi:sortase A
VTLGKPIGMIEIPRLGLSSVVIEGDDVAALLLGVGHLADTPLPWHGGNSVLAAHRDTFFRPLAGIRRNDLIRFSTADAEFEYVVKETMIVGPTDVEVLDPTDTATLTLITCYPFDYIGPAPNRFIVRAERRSRAPVETDA